MKQSQPLRIENPEMTSLITSRTTNSALWFVNNARLEEQILANLARYQDKYEVELYSFVLQGNHYHATARFPGCNRASFCRDFNARLAESVRSLVTAFRGGPLFGRRYSEQALPGPEDIEERFFYCALQPVLAGLTEKANEYPGYNSFTDAIDGRAREFEIVDWARYNARRRVNPSVKRADFTRKVVLKYKRLPGYEHLSQKEYRTLMLKKYEERRQKILAERRAEGKQFLGGDALRAIKPGTYPSSTKVSGRYSYRPLVLCVCRIKKREYLDWYFAVYERYKLASQRYRRGERHAEFPPFTYKPPGSVLVH